MNKFKLGDRVKVTGGDLCCGQEGTVIFEEIYSAIKVQFGSDYYYIHSDNLTLVGPRWMVFVEGTRGPSVMHEGLIPAMQEAERLAKKEVGKRVYVLKTVEAALVVPSPVTWSKL